MVTLEWFSSFYGPGRGPEIQKWSRLSGNCGIWGQARSRFQRNKRSPNACDENMVGDKSLGPFQSWHRLRSSLHMKKPAFRLIINQEMKSKCYSHFIIFECDGGAVDECSKTLQLREKINENQKIPGSSPGLGNFLNKYYRWRFDSVVSKTRRQHFVQSWLKSRWIGRWWVDKPRRRFLDWHQQRRSNSFLRIRRLGARQEPRPGGWRREPGTRLPPGIPPAPIDQL